jgi:hypothetical protein
MVDHSMTSINDCTLTLKADSEAPFLTRMSSNERNLTLIPNLSLSTIINKNSSSISTSLKQFFKTHNIDYNTTHPMSRDTPGSYHQSLIIEIEKPIKTYINTYKHLIIIKCNRVTTYYVNNYVFSALTNPERFEADFKIPNLVFKPRLKTGFSINDTTCTQLSSKFDPNVIRKFFESVNAFMLSKSNQEVKEHNNNARRYYLITGLVLFALFAGLTISAFIFDDVIFDSDGVGLWVKIILFLLLLIVLFYFILRNFFNAFYVQGELLKFNLLEDRVKIYPDVNECLEIWNKFVFLPEKIYVVIPVSFDYMQFIFDATKEIKIENHVIYDK